ncbi:MAG: hypothetical protein BWK79_05935 [Beggiatoa sp. IS2]|nr:MAG: hypothetical protein BWK79_05935 [Beggiatoa sp. IS2]
MRLKWILVSWLLIVPWSSHANERSGTFNQRIVTSAEANLQIEKAVALVEALAPEAKGSIPNPLLKEAKALVVITEMTWINIGIGGNLGRGIAVVREDDHQWSYPSLVSLAGGSFGAPLKETTNIVLLFKNRTQLEKMSKITLSSNLGLMPGPINQVKTHFDAEIYAYSHHREVFAGISLQGLVLESDQAGNKALYGKEIQTTDIFAGKVTNSSSAIQQLQEILQKF